ncbi:putative transcription factor lepB [Lachnellula arida]|uniref:Putative transcription factor lepB n=1 Tax=Lachnellula arida TaxID=1316785 RepID=A0A8T9B7B0_9HELO|nr:putative transcription factor lepB [Lachnellula arida]
MSEDQQPRVPRQRPVSCRFCRSRKLRCSREAPCSNCVSRGVRCELQAPIRSPSKAHGASEPELLERIRKLEDIVKSQKAPRNADAGVERQSENSDIHAQQGHPPVSSPQIEHLDDDVAWLQSIYNAQDSSGQQPYINQKPCPSSTHFEPLRCVWLPLYTEAKILLEKYIDDIDHVHHLAHSPSIPAVLDDVYECLNQGQVKPGNIMLLLGLFAAATQGWVQPDCRRGLFSTCAEANSQSPMWIKAVEDVLDIFHRTSSVPMEGIQAVSITSFVLLNMEGYTRRCKALCDMALNLSRDLGLHLLDHPSNAQSANSARTEIGRRVWWYLVATDWFGFVPE